MYTALTRGDTMNEILKAIEQVSGDIKALDKKIDNVENGLTHKINYFESKLTQKIDSVESGLTQKIGDVESKLTQKIDGVESKLTQEISDVESRLTQEISTVESRLTYKIDNVDADLRTLIDLDVNRKIQIIADSQVELIEKFKIIPEMQEDIREIKYDVAALTVALKTHVHD